MRFVQVKSVEQQGQLMLHRTRDLLMRQRTQVINALRAHMAELGIVAAQGREMYSQFADAAADILLAYLHGKEVPRFVRGH
jgi:transposase